MNERLNKLRFSLGIDWGELARRLGISRSMLGFIRRGDRPVSAKLHQRICQLERETSSQTVATCPNCQMLLNRVIELEAQLLNEDKISDERSQAVLQLIRDFDTFKKHFVSGAEADAGDKKRRGDSS